MLVVNLLYLNEVNRNIYIYFGEEIDLIFIVMDEFKIKDLKFCGFGDINYNNVISFGLVVGNIVDSVVISGVGFVFEDKKIVIIKMIGIMNLIVGKKWISVIVVKDDNNGESVFFNGRINVIINFVEC